MGGENKEEKKKPASKKSSSSIDTSSLIFFILMVVGIIVFVIIMIHNNSKKIYTTNFGESIKTTIELKTDTDFILTINVDKDTISQKGTYKAIENAENEYEMVFDDNDEKAKFKLDTIKDKDTEKDVLIFTRNTGNGEYSITLEKQ